MARTSAPDASSLVGVFATLSEEHREAAALLKRVMDDPVERTALWPSIRATLVSHEQGEVREVFPVLRASGDLRELADHHDSEARTLDQMISELDAMPLENDAWMKVFTALATTVLQHASEEEAQIFPAAQSRLGRERTIELDATYRDAKAKLVRGHVAPPREPQAVPARRA